MSKSETKRDGAEMLSPLSNNALTNYAAERKSCGLMWTVMPNLLRAHVASLVHRTHLPQNVPDMHAA